MANSNLQYKWDLESLLGQKSLEALFDEYVEFQNKILSLYPSFLDNVENFINFHEQSEQFIRLSNRLRNYLSNNYQEDLKNPKWISWLQKLSNNDQNYLNTLSNYEFLIATNEEKIREYLKKPECSEFQRYFEYIFRFRPHILSQESELLLAKLSPNNGAIDDIFSSLTDSDFKYTSAVNNQNEVVPLKTQADIFKNLRSKDEILRRSSWYSFHKTFFQFRNTLTKTLYYNYLMLNTHAKVRNFDDYISQTAFYDEVDKSFIERLYKNVKQYRPLFARFQAARKKYLKHLLNKEELMPWDMYLELTNEDKQYTIEDIKAIALESLSILGDDYTKLVQKAFDERWISFLPSPGKQTGAYSIGGTKGLDKYFISMNFDSTIQSAFTLVHELGHSMNSYFYGQKQKIYQETKIFYAEIASITNEMILSHYLLDKSKDNLTFRLMILDEVISGFFSTTSRQVIFSNFEWIANSWVNEGSEFTYERIQKTYYELMKEYLGTNLTYEKYCKDPFVYNLVTPLRISHFYSGNFYVYKYAIGQIAAIIIADEIINNVPNAREKLFNFLSSGTSLSPLDTIKLLGIDLQTDDPYKKSIAILDKWIKEFIEIVDYLSSSKN